MRMTSCFEQSPQNQGKWVRRETATSLPQAAPTAMASVLRYELQRGCKATPLHPHPPFRTGAGGPHVPLWGTNPHPSESCHLCDCSSVKTDSGIFLEIKDIVVLLFAIAAIEYSQIVAIGQIKIIGRALQQRRDDRKTSTIERSHKGRRLFTHTKRLQVHKRKLHQEGISRKKSFPSGN